MPIPRKGYRRLFPAQNVTPLKPDSESDKPKKVIKKNVPREKGNERKR